MLLLVLQVQGLCHLPQEALLDLLLFLGHAPCLFLLLSFASCFLSAAQLEGPA